MNFAAEDPTSDSVAQASAPQLIRMRGPRIAHRERHCQVGEPGR